MKEEEMNLENLKSKIKKFKWTNRIMIITTILLFSISTYRIVNFNDGHIILGLTISLVLPAVIITINILNNKIYKLQLVVNKLKYDNDKLKQKLKEDNARINNILENEELMNKIKEKIKSDEEHKN